MDPLFSYNSMQAQAGLLPAPQVVFPGQISAAIATQGGVGAFGSFFPSQTYQTAVGTPPIFQGPTGVMAPINPSAPYNPYAAQNPYAGLSAYGAFRGTPSPFTPYAPNPPPAYAGFQGTGAVPFAPAPPPSAFDTPYGGQLAQAQAAQDRAWVIGQGAQGVGARAAAGLTAAGAGAMMGRRFGAWGMAAGAVAGLLGSELSGMGQGAQNLYGSWVTSPRLAEYGGAAGLEHLSRGFVSGGPHLHAGGQGFSHHASLEASRGITALAGSSSFRRETRDRFNQQDLFKVTQGASEAGLMTGVGSPDQMTSRVRDVARSLSAFMELAREPDVVRAIQTMGSLRASGLNLHETTAAVSAGRSFARMAGTTFQGLAEIGGAMGSSAFQSMGLTQGLGFQVGMGNYAQAASSINRGTLSPQMAALTGGAQGLGTLNTMFSGALLQLPMVTPGAMSTGGGLNAGAIQNMLSGRSDLFSMTGRGSNVLTGMTERLGVGGLGMAVAMQPMLQDSLGRMIQAQGPFAQRNMEDRQVLSLARQMGMGGSQGFLTAAQALGMDRTQALARATEMGSGAYWSTQRAQLATDQREARAVADRNYEEGDPSVLGTLYRQTWAGRAGRAMRGGIHHLGVNLSGAFGGEEAHGLYGGDESEEGRRRVRGAYRTASYANYVARQPHTDAPEDVFDRVSTGYRYAQLHGASGLGAGFVAAGRLLTDDATERRRQRYTIQSGAGFASDVVGATEAQRRAAMGRVGELFGGGAGLSDVSTSLSRMANDFGSRGNKVDMIGGASLFVPGGAGGTLAPLLVGTRGMEGSEIYERYRNVMRRRGMSEDQIRTNWRTERGAIATAVGADLESRGMTAEERRSWEHTQRSLRDSAGDTEAGQAAVRTAYGRVLGHAGAEGREGYDTVMDEARGLGREGTAGYERSRRAVGALAALRALRPGGTSAERESADAARARILSGFSDAEQAQIARRAGTLGARYEGNERVLAAARGMLEGDSATLLDRMGGAEETRINEKARRAAATGFSMMARQGGVLGDALRDVQGSDRDGVRRALEGLSPDQLHRLRRERGGARLAALLERGDFAGVEALAGGMGEGADADRRNWDTEHSTRRRVIEGGANLLAAQLPFANLSRSFRERVGSAAHSFVDSMRERAVMAGLTPRSGAEREAALGARESAGTQSEMEGAGIGRASDALLEAARDLKETSENLRNSTVAGALTSLVGQ